MITLSGKMGKTYKMMQKVGDRDKPTISFKDHAFCINANPMSDRQQLVVEIEDEQQSNKPTKGNNRKVVVL
jgi:hypothetical protein